MGRATKLKVYRTPIGFHDAYVAAPSQKAALAAWGSDANLFARGVAEEVTEAALTAEPLARPGEVVRRLRGTAAEQFAALPPDPPKPPRSPDKRAEAKPGKAPPPPRPDRAPLDQAEQALVEAERRHKAESRTLADLEAELARQRRTLADRQENETAALEQARNRARADYDRAMAAWRR